MKSASAAVSFSLFAVVAASLMGACAEDGGTAGTPPRRGGGDGGAAGRGPLPGSAGTASGSAGTGAGSAGLGGTDATGVGGGSVVAGSAGSSQTAVGGSSSVGGASVSVGGTTAVGGASVSGGSAGSVAGNAGNGAGGKTGGGGAGGAEAGAGAGGNGGGGGSGGAGGVPGGPPPCVTTIHYGANWLATPGSPGFDLVEGDVTWDGTCIHDGPNSFAQLSNGFKPYFAGRTCSLAFDRASCPGAPTSCVTRILYGASWIAGPDHPARFDDVGAVVTWDGVCKDEGPNSLALLSNGYQPLFAGNASCDLSFRYEQCAK